MNPQEPTGKYVNGSRSSKKDYENCDQEIDTAPEPTVPLSMRIMQCYGLSGPGWLCSALTSTCHPRKYRISATRHPRSTVGGIGHPFASVQMLIAAPPSSSSLPYVRYTPNSHRSTLATTV